MLKPADALSPPQHCMSRRGGERTQKVGRDHIPLLCQLKLSYYEFHIQQYIISTNKKINTYRVYTQKLQKYQNISAHGHQ